MLALLLTTLALATSLFSNTATASPTKSRARLSSRASASSPQYSLVHAYSYPNFFDSFTLYNESDPTLGYIDYVDRSIAQKQELIGWIYREETHSSTAWISADSTSRNTAARQSVRLISDNTFGIGTLAVIDCLHMPVGGGPGGAGLWPAVWFLGQGEWPYTGEIDVIEYVNPALRGINRTLTHNSMTLHTGPGCVVADTPSEYSGSLVNTNCSFTENETLGALGCSIPAPLNNTVNNTPFATAGPAFNAQGGGVYVMSWTADGVTVWLFPRTAQPSDLISGNPDPSSWTQIPLAKFSGSGCDFSQALTPMNLIINIDICGQWAGEDYVGGWEACNNFARDHPEAYKDAYFEFESIKMYGSN